MTTYKGINGFAVQSVASDPTFNEGQVWYNNATYAFKLAAVTTVGTFAAGGNLNNAIDSASSDYIKIMFQDDFFVTKDALDIINKKFNEPAKWGASACIHYSSDSGSFYRPHYPRWQLNIKRGENTIGCPSVSFFNRCELRFDTNLLWYMDTDFYYRLFQKYGEPNIENKILIGVREDNTRVSNTLITDELINRENQIISKKYV